MLGQAVMFLARRRRGRSGTTLAGALAIVAALLTAAGAYADVPPVTGDQFTIVAIPDTQEYVKSSDSSINKIFTDQANWIANHRSSLNIQFVSDLGDIVDTDSSTTQWSRADAALSILRATNIPQGILPGNHDFDSIPNSTIGMYEANILASNFTSLPWWTAADGFLAPGQPFVQSGDPDRQFADNFELFSADGLDFVNVSLEYAPTTAEVNWASRVIKAYPNRYAIISTHGYVNIDGSLATSWNAGSQSGAGGTSETPSQIFTNLVKPNCNVVMVINGHYNSSTIGSARRSDTNSCGSTVYGFLSDYQSIGACACGLGLIRYYVVSPSAGQISAYTYNVETDTYQTGDADQFTVPYTFALSQAVTAPGAPTGVIAQAGDSSAVVSWTAPASNGGAAISGYKVTPYIGSTAQPPTSVGAVTSTTITGLTNGTAYTFRVTASNSQGDGPTSDPSSSVTPQASAVAPGQPTGVSAVAGDTSAFVTWSAPVSNGGSPITGYVVTPFDGGTAQTPRTVGAVTSSRVTGLTNGHSYTFTVAAVNAVNTGVGSAPSAAVIPRAPVDYNGDGKTDVAVFRPSTGVWYISGQASVTLGRSGDIPAAADYNGDGKADVALFRPSTGVWYVNGQPSVTLGKSGDVPVPGDYNGDGKADVAVFRPSTGVWYVNGQSTITLGRSGDIAVPADYNGDGKTDAAVFRPSTGVWYINGQSSVPLGRSGDIPVPGDYNGDGKADVAVFRPSTGVWYRNGQSSVTLGRASDIPVPGDYNGDGKSDVAVFRPSTGVWYISGQSSVTLGRSGDIPNTVFPADWLSFFAKK